MAKRVAAALIVLALAATGCGEGGASSGATVSIYVAAPLCRGAQRQLARERAAVEDLRIRAICLPPTDSNGRLDLAQTGANARGAAEDSTTIAYLEPPGPAAKFSRPVLESADIAGIATSSGSTGMRHVLRALIAGGSRSPRATVVEFLSGS